jgi:phosphate acyltransferase
MIIALDAMGGDHAPEQIVRGAMLAAGELDAQVALVGRPQEIEAVLGQHYRRDKLLIRPASEVVEMEDSPRLALRGKPDSSVAQTVNMVLAGDAQACVSAGNSGAFMALCHTRLRTIPGIHRPAIAFVVPTLTGPRIVLDAGANADCKPVYLQQFGIMGSIYAEYVLRRPNPRVGILSIGTEDHKGNELTQAAMPLLSAAPINFIGNVEGDQLFSDDIDVIVTDGFVGNVVLKVIEGVSTVVLQALREGIQASFQAKMGALLMRHVFRGTRKRFHYSTYGGALLLGVNGICMVAHGKSDPHAIRNALLAAECAVKAGVVDHVREVCGALFPPEAVAEPAE